MGWLIKVTEVIEKFNNPWDSKPILKPFNHKGSCAHFVFVGDTMATQSAFSITF
jgi:hypothetical protein